MMKNKNRSLQTKSLWSMGGQREERSLRAVWRNIGFVHTWKLLDSHRQIKLFVKLTDSHSCAPHFMDLQAHRCGTQSLRVRANGSCSKHSGDSERTIGFHLFCLCFDSVFIWAHANGRVIWLHAKAQTLPISIRCHRDCGERLNVSDTRATCRTSIPCNPHRNPMSMLLSFLRAASDWCLHAISSSFGAIKCAREKFQRTQRKIEMQPLSHCLIASMRL